MEDNFFKLSENSSYTFPRKIIGWIGRFDKTKNPTQLFNIASAFTSRNDIECYIAGTPSKDNINNYVSAEIKRFKGSINFVWLPFIDHRKIHKFYIMLRISGGACGSLYRLWNIKEATKAITNTLENHSYRDKIVQNAYNKVKENLTIAKVSLQWKSLFGMLLKV